MESLDTKEITPKKLEGVLKDAYESLKNVNWYAFTICRNSITNKLGWYERASDNESCANVYDLYTIHNKNIHIVTDEEVWSYMAEYGSDMYLELTEEELEKLYELSKKEGLPSGYDYETKEEFMEEYSTQLEDVEKINPKKAKQFFKELKATLQEEYKEDNKFIEMTIEEKAKYIVSGIAE